MGIGFVGLVCICGILVSIGTGFVRRYALANALLDIPNERSSHVVATPRGGGLAISLVLVAGVATALWLGLVEGTLALALIGGGVPVAAIGWIDDRRHVPARWRSLVHLMAGTWAVVVLGGMDAIRFGLLDLYLGVIGSLLAVVGIVWSVNLYNFMDGIDGIAGGEAAVVGLIAAALAWYSGAFSIMVCAAMIAAAATGFLVWNWPPAKIFMGDCGSGFLGYLFAVLAIASETQGGPPLLMWLILLGVFVFDSTATLMRRVFHGQRWYSAHRNHAYQRAVQAGWSHAYVAIAVLSITIVMGVLATWGLVRPEHQAISLLGAAGFLWLCYRKVERVRPMYADNQAFLEHTGSSSDSQGGHRSADLSVRSADKPAASRREDRTP